MSLSLQQMLNEIDQLTPEEQLTVMGYLVERMKQYVLPVKRKRKWSELKGMVSYPLFGEDAQDWVSRTREEGGKHREDLLQE
ncbi:hypothetical protein NIES2111_47580 [Nostoc sp. NIES-2111]|nr:hypothetical protein NIES2111_47580 [Nostoc sp. NIES-2111]